ncbi:LANO_0C02432g1_1 [Lachancea nothofagi CBS 11611]|uniref:LANO_0C02432g1_1 n=1 Tax=Lachancea nothofagi CBS 11611 TaxID=1266666 RepID=A0A1G4J4T3_9SACH|nr:LANO_0C02432g1_1 [Lachancea nothofagi CBS 11611]
MSDAHELAALNVRHKAGINQNSQETTEAFAGTTFISVLADKFRRRFGFVRTGFLPGLFVDQTYVYPLLGFFKFLVTPSFWLYSLVLAFCFACIFVTVAALYYFFILPIILVWAVATLGPIGFVIVHIQWLLQSNALAITLTNILIAPVFANSIFDAVLAKLGHAEFLENAKKLPVTPSKVISWKSLDYWLIVLPGKIITLKIKIATTIFLSLLSLIPVIGPTLVNQLLSPKRGFSYSRRLYVLKNLSSGQIKDKFYEHLGQYTAFGMMAGLLELIPVMSIITIPSNLIAGALWASNELNKNQT